MEVGHEGQVRGKSEQLSLQPPEELFYQGTWSPFGKEKPSPCQVPCMILTGEQPKQGHRDSVFKAPVWNLPILVSFPCPGNCAKP